MVCFLNPYPGAQPERRELVIMTEAVEKRGVRGGRRDVFRSVKAKTPIGRRMQFDGGDQALIAAISGSTPRMVIIRFRL
jgi:hypothetical protein